MVKILRYRTIAAIYPYTSFEAEVKVDDNIYYFNMDVSDKETVDVEEDQEWWSYKKPIDDETLRFDTDEDEVNLDNDVNHEVLKEMAKIWNADPTWDDSSEWKVA